MSKTEYVLTLQIPIELWSNTGSANALCDAEKFLEDDGYEDGRHPFDREMFTLALSRMLRHAAFKSVCRLMDQKYGARHMTETEDGAYNTAYRAAEDWIRDDFKSVVVEQEDWKVSLKQVLGG